MQKFSTVLGGRPLTVEVGKYAKQASGAAMVRYGDTVVLVTATASAEPREGIDFFPMTVDYEERMYAAGKIPGGFIKREGRPTEAAILAARLTDRSLRPLFPKGFRNDVHVVAIVMSVDKDNAPEITALNGASCALSFSDIPFKGPIGAVAVGRVDGEFIINPTAAQQEKSEMHLVVAGTKDAVMMVEAGANEIPEAVMLDAIMFGHDAIKELVAFQERIAQELGVVKREVRLFQPPEELSQAVREYASDKLRQAVFNPDKLLREELIQGVKSETLEHFREVFQEQEKVIKEVLESILKTTVRKMITEEGIRPDGRRTTEIRPIYCETGILPRTHGSGLFVRGQTQVLTVCTLGAVGDIQILDGLGIAESKRYMHHYNMPPFSVGETRPMRGPGRREIGHGALAERALEPMVPPEDQFPYTIRLVSDVLESNGSTSMGSVCGSTLALMDAGAPLKEPVSGIAMGLIKEEERFAILSDIQGIEDNLGDMDFKVAGTKNGVTALQMDIKIAGVSREILDAALKQARDGRMHIMGKMLEVISEPRKEMSPYAPRMITFTIDPDKIREVIGPGGKIIKKIIEETGATIDIEDDGRVFIASIDPGMGERAAEIVQNIVKEVEVGKVYNGKVVRLMDFGAFVEIIPGVLGLSGKEGLVHISQLAEERVGKVRDVVKEGDEIQVKVTEIDRQGRINLSRKEVLRSQRRAKEKEV
ncbi:MAG: polyribonucleotide nucleotidyltransferase [Firmicutes bacterium]|nr:polyribonucleotide nucleotidyltransferase [Bacillota bacterium]